MFLPFAVGLAAALLLLAGGYLLGVQRGQQSRDLLRSQLATAQAEANRAKARGGNGGEDENLREAIRSVLAPLVQREQLNNDLARIEGGGGSHRDLTALLDQLVEKGNFFGGLLTDEQGWLVAASTGLRDVERLGATATLLRVLADRIHRDGAAAPLSLMVHDAANVTTLTRLFVAANQRLSLTVVSAGRSLTPSALDPILVKLNATLVARELTGPGAVA